MSHNTSITIQPTHSLSPEEIIKRIGGPTSLSNLTNHIQHFLPRTHRTVYIGASHIRYTFDYTLYLSTNRTSWRRIVELYELPRKHADSGIPDEFSFELCTDVYHLFEKIQRICNASSSNNKNAMKTIVVIETGSHDLSDRGSAILYDIGLKKIMHYFNGIFNKNKEKRTSNGNCDNVFFIFWTLIPMPADKGIAFRGMRNEGTLLAFSQLLKDSIHHINSTNVRVIDAYNIIAPWGSQEIVCGFHYICISNPPRYITNWTSWDSSTDCWKLGFANPLLSCSHEFLVTRAGDVVIRKTLDEMNDIMLSW